ncbi:MAG: cobalamin-binding protein [Chloroflexi bacterium]|nr:cobalamin-binding protein [Chloroflexota bacterium]
MKEKLDPIYDAILDGDMRGMEALVQDALDAKLDVGMILHECLIPAMDEVGRLFEKGDYFVPEMLIAAMAMKAGLAVLRPLLVESAIEPTGQVVIGTVKGDMHDIGKNLVGMMLEGAGFEIEDLGVDVDPDQFVAAIKEKGADIVGLSALLTTTMPSIEKTIKAIDAAGLRDQVKILVGGAPVTKAYAEAVGADGFATDAGQASALAKQFVKQR